MIKARITDLVYFDSPCWCRVYHTHVTGVLVCQFSCIIVLGVCFLLRDKQEAKFGGVMSAQNTHHMPACEHVFGSFHLVISVVIVVYLILNLLCISSEKGGIWRLCGDLKRRLEESLALTS